MQTIKEFWSTTRTRNKFAVSFVALLVLASIISALLFETPRIIIIFLVVCFTVAASIVGTADAICAYNNHRRYGRKD